jgi:hypothetical protein
MAEPAVTESTTERPSRRAFIHPYAAALLLGLDWLLFSGTVLSGGAALIGGSVGGFFIATIGVALIQARLAKNKIVGSIVKGVFSGALVAAPFPVAGTLVGGFILGLAGLNSLRDIASSESK